MNERVHIFISTGRFHSLEELRTFIDKTYDDEGNSVPSVFIEETGLDEYEPMCIEAIISKTGQPVPLTTLLEGASWAETWLPQLDGTHLADAAICVFLPNTLAHPEQSSLEYLGAFPFMN